MLLERAAGKTLNPYQGLKQQREAAGKGAIKGRKNPKSLSGIETLRFENAADRIVEPEKP